MSDSESGDPPEPSPVYYLGRKRETTAERVRRLQVEASILARQEIEAMEKSLNEMAELAAAIAQGGDAYPVGIRELCSRIAEDLPMKASNLRSLIDRIPEPKL